MQDLLRSSTVVEAHDPLPAIPTKLTKKLLQDLLVDAVIFREGELPGLLGQKGRIGIGFSGRFNPKP